MFNRLLQCPLQVSLDRLNRHPNHANRQIPENAALGLLVHRAFELSYRNKVSFESAWLAAKSEENFIRFDFESLKAYRRTRLRAEKRFMDVQNLVAEHGGNDPEPEVEIQASNGQITGQIDLFVGGKSPFVLDYKTGLIQDEEGNLEEKITRQLHIYAGAISEQRGIVVTTGYIITMTSAPIKIDIDPSYSNELLLQMVTVMNEFNARKQGHQPAIPDVTNCHWCRHAHNCDALKLSIANDNTFRPGGFDSIWGEIMGIPQISRSGLSTIRVKPALGTIQNEFTLFDVPQFLLATVHEGSTVALSGVSQSGEARNWKTGVTRISSQ
jgi:hypothetical protein